MSRRDAVFDAFRRWGYLQADLDRLGRLKKIFVPEAEIEGPEAGEARRRYAGTLAVEFMHIPNPDRRAWVIEKMESDPPEPDQRWICERLAHAEIFETVIQRRYVGTKRFSIEGIASLIPLLAELIEASQERGAEELVFGMAHRGRLNVIVNIVGRDPAEVFAQFEDVDPRSVLGGGDVKYHLGANGTYRTRNGRPVRISLVSNPSHVEAVNPVLLGRTRAKQARRGPPGPRQVVPVTLHGDAGFAGQGIASESLNLADLPGYTVGGTIHVVVNNLVGFTTTPDALHSSPFASDVAKRLAVPIFHVNAEDPEAAVRAARFAAEFRATFDTDVVIDLIGFRRWGHSEVDDPSLTQPALYAKIAQRPPAWESYAKQAGIDPAEMKSRVEKNFDAAHDAARAKRERPALFTLPDYWSKYRGGRYGEHSDVDTSVPLADLQRLADRLTRRPDGFAAHPKVLKGLEHRAKMGKGEEAVDWAMAEALAFASLVDRGIPIRLTGEDSRRGTFNQRHAVLFDVNTEREYVPLAQVREGQARFECYDSPLSEAAALGYEYGVSRDAPETLVLWEAQFGDFANGAQVIVDQFIGAGEDKWGLLFGLVLLLPHGYEGQGPEHSSARIERFLQLAAEDNMEICQPSTAAQYFHLLRRQALRSWRKPLIVFTPKSLLRDPSACSPIQDLARERFRPVLRDEDVADPERILIGTGKVVHLLRAARARRKDSRTAVVSLDRLYPFPELELKECMTVPDIVWVQEEPANMGALAHVMPILRRLAQRPVRSVKRSRSASPATGSLKAHRHEEEALIEMAFAREI
ncbi:MAG: 2-oxoglutarate dehydrogenase E1 component [Planctomycetes bacterium]|nr:2-oxoglutarate dehydrogenase E1 component [Planctomycetota bacterium]